MPSENEDDDDGDDGAHILSLQWGFNRLSIYTVPAPGKRPLNNRFVIMPNPSHGSKPGTSFPDVWPWGSHHPSGAASLAWWGPQWHLRDLLALIFYYPNKYWYESFCGEERNTLLICEKWNTFGEFLYSVCHGWQTQVDGDVLRIDLPNDSP